MKVMEPRTIAVFGGSFNPPHVGHVLAASYALTVGFERVIAPVVYQHAFGKKLTSFENRLEMARLAFAPLPSVEVSDIERRLPHPNRSLETLQALQRLHPGRSFRLLTGSDVMTDADKWHRFDEVVRLAPPFVLGRQGTANQADYPCVLPEVSSTQIRQRLALSEAEQDPWLVQHIPATVLDYVRAKRLFTCTNRA